MLLAGCAVSPEGDGTSISGGGGRGGESLTPANDLARFLAGMPGNGSPRLRKLRDTAEWKAHQQRMDQLWASFERGYLPHVRSFRGELGGMTSPGVLFYPFGGPDYLYAHAFFPGASNYVLVGLESADPLPDLAALSDGEILSSLGGIARSLQSSLTASYFVTKDMRVDLASSRFRGTLPLLMVMAARNGQSIGAAEAVGLTASGALTSRSAGSGAPGVRVAVGGRNLYYFREDLSDGGGRRVMNFVRSKGAPVTFIKSASYLMHSGGFSGVRNFILTESRAILQDASGVPYRNLNDSGFRLTLYGNYSGTLDIFASHGQSDLAEAYRTGSPHPVKPLKFGVGYLRTSSNACLIVARK
ncbi:MAG: hypothetical protein KDM91_04930 [Verrucomicrobiae bacterium]|nr:hypothetical protein [Verrucomicrobiae bacterium]MCP5541727.1 hypothetical protein [Akkermansiaceae bacterium]